ncbi:MAG: hypothetical protein KME26_11790 [Oscillatoria princeps RMCB-10]|nr:hypothetical protein [Oscillatoria princeps RMCB-10]
MSANRSTYFLMAGGCTRALVQPLFALRLPHSPLTPALECRLLPQLRSS